jgi:hypothetical protein
VSGSAQSSLIIFLCPQTSRQFSSVQLEYDLLNVDLDEGDSVQPLEHKLDDDSGCWVYQKDNPNVKYTQFMSFFYIFNIIVVLEEMYF